MELSQGQRRHLVSVYASVRHLLRQMEDAAREGRSPTGVGATLTPLPPEQTEPILAPVRQLASRIRELAAAMAPEELAALETPQGTQSTLVWMSNLVNRARGEGEDLQPNRLGKDGALSEDKRRTVSGLHEELLAVVQEARAGLDGAV